MCHSPSRIVAIFTLVLFVLSFSRSALAAEDVNNAAPIYLKLIEQLPTGESAESGFLNEADSIALQGPVVRFLMTTDEIAQQFHAAGLRGRCDWPADTERTLVLKVLRLSDLERMRTRWAIEEERIDEAAAECADVAVFARFVGRMPSSSARMAAAGIAQEVTGKLAALLPMASDKTLADLHKRINDLPRWFTAVEVIDGDGKTIVEELKRLDVEKSPELFAKTSALYARTGGDTPSDESAAARTQIKLLWADSSKRLTAITAVSLRYAEAAKIAAMPRMVVAKASDEWQQKRLKDDVLTRAVVPSGKFVERVQRICLVSDVRAAILQAAVTGRISGTDAAIKTLDPSTGKPFGLREWEEGFELRSDLKDVEGKPLKLMVGKAGKVPF